jgi:hypothetical protein
LPRLVLKAIRSAAAQLARLPQSPDLDELRGTASACAAEAEAWKDAPPTDVQRDAMMKRVLALQVAVTKARRR